MPSRSSHRQNVFRRRTQASPGLKTLTLDKSLHGSLPQSQGIKAWGTGHSSSGLLYMNALHTTTLCHTCLSFAKIPQPASHQNLLEIPLILKMQLVASSVRPPQSAWGEHTPILSPYWRQFCLAFTSYRTLGLLLDCQLLLPATEQLPSFHGGSTHAGHSVRT